MYFPKISTDIHVSQFVKRAKKLCDPQVTFYVCVPAPLKFLLITLAPINYMDKISKLKVIQRWIENIGDEETHCKLLKWTKSRLI